MRTARACLLSASAVALGAPAWLSLLALTGGCVATPSQSAMALVEDVVSDIGLPVEWDGLRVQEVSVRPHAVYVQYLRHAPPAHCYVLRFARSPMEQRPEQFRDLDALLASVARVSDPDSFTITARERRATRWDGPLDVVFFAMKEDGSRREGAACLWEEPCGEGAWVYLLRYTTTGSLESDALESILQTMRVNG